MSTFECTQCGLCCLGIGEIVRMDRQISKYGFYVKNEVVGETKAVLITPEYRDLFDNDHSVQEEHKAACFFVRRRPDGKYVCTIHPGRLFICKDYHCCAARISKNGVEVGRVKGKVSLVTKDETLKEICRAVDIPVIAIGGISRNNVMELKGSGICGIAVISAVFAQKDVEEAAGKLKKQVEDMLA